MRDIGEGWGQDDDAIVTGSQSMKYCLGCQEVVMELPGSPPVCPTCKRPYRANDPATYETERHFHLAKFWLPPAVLGALLSAICFGIVYWKIQSGMAWLAIFPAPLGLIAGFVNRPILLIVFQILVSGLFATTICIVSGTLWAMPTAICAGVFTLLPVAMGYLLGQLLRHLLQESRWSQRAYL
jgi:hypothetical protein